MIQGFKAIGTDRILTVESKYLLVDSFIKYRIVDVLTFTKLITEVLIV